jgi:hypothetical protein
MRIIIITIIMSYLAKVPAENKKQNQKAVQYFNRLKDK